MLAMQASAILFTFAYFATAYGAAADIVTFDMMDGTVEPDIDIPVPLTASNAREEGKLYHEHVFKSKAKVNGKDAANVYIVQMPRRKCTGYQVFSIERSLVLEKGRAKIHMFSAKDKTMVTECLGDPLIDKDCSYSVSIPADAISVVEPESVVTYTIVFVLGSTADHREVSIDDMKRDFPRHVNAIDDIVKECQAA